MKHTLHAFGCSNTLGEGLADCDPMPSGKTAVLTASQQAWPQLTADQLGWNCDNHAVQGNSNRFIAHQILNTEFEPNSWVVVMWSYVGRSCVILTEGNQDNWLNCNTSVIKHRDRAKGDGVNRVYNLAPWLIRENKRNREYYRHVHVGMDSQLAFFRNLELADLHLKRLRVPVLHTVCRPVDVITQPSWSHAVLDTSISIDPEQDKGTDGVHPGPLTHQAVAHEIVERIRSRF